MVTSDMYQQNTYLSINIHTIAPDHSLKQDIIQTQEDIEYNLQPDIPLPLPEPQHYVMTALTALVRAGEAHAHIMVELRSG